jgi:hypothetical protein
MMDALAITLIYSKKGKSGLSTSLSKYRNKEQGK